MQVYTPPPIQSNNSTELDIASGISGPGSTTWCHHCLSTNLVSPLLVHQLCVTITCPLTWCHQCLSTNLASPVLVHQLGVTIACPPTWCHHCLSTNLVSLVSTIGVTNSNLFVLLTKVLKFNISQFLIFTEI